MVSPELLRRFTLFAGLNPEAFKELALMSEELMLEAGEWLFHENEKAHGLYLVQDGIVALMLNLDEEGIKKTEIETVVAGEVVGWSVVVEPFVYTIGALAETNCKLIKIDGERLRKSLDQNPEWGYLMMKRVAKTIGVRLRQMRVRLVSVVG